MKRIFKPKIKNSGDNKIIEPEEAIEDVKFNVFKLNNRPKPSDPKRILICSVLSEFGCEVVASMYCLPKIFQQYPGYYKIIVGWHGREYLYRHLADEFWEIKEEHQWLRDYCRAFHHESKNLKKVEDALTEYGRVIRSDKLGRIAIGAKCHECKAVWGTTNHIDKCSYCDSEKVTQSMFGDIEGTKKVVKRIPNPSNEKIEEAKKYLGKNPVGIFARGRRCYGRNLQPEFYKDLIKLLEHKNYTPIWLGEKQSTLPCPVDHITDFSRMAEARDLELTLAIVSQLKFTVQYWTASTRLAGMMGVPYLLFESPDQIWGNGQEGFRRNLCDFGKSKLAICHYLNVKNNNIAGIELTKKCIEEMEAENYEDVFGLVDRKAAESLKNKNLKRIGTNGNT